MIRWENFSRIVEMYMSSSTTKTVKKPTVSNIAKTPPPPIQQKSTESMAGKDKEKLEMAPSVIQDMFQKIQETLLQTQEKIMANQEEMRAFNTEFKKELGEVKDDMKMMKDKMGDIQDSISENKHKIRESEKKIDYMEAKVDTMEQKTLQLNKEMSDSLAMLEIERASYYLRFQNVQEEKDENLGEKMVEIIGDITEKTQVEIRSQIEDIYRVQTNYIRRHKLDREVHIKFTNKSIRDEIYRKARDKETTFGDKEIIILKQIPRRIRYLRHNYQFLTQKLNKYKITFRWLPIEGILIFWEDKKHRIDTIEKAKDFYDKHFKTESETEQESKEELETRSTEEDPIDLNQIREFKRKQGKEKEEKEGAIPKFRMELRNTKKHTQTKNGGSN